MSSISMSTASAGAGGLAGLKLVPVLAIVPALKSLLIVVVFSSFLVPTAIVLFASSTRALRRRPTFILNLCAIVLGLVQGGMVSYVSIQDMIGGRPNTSLISASVGTYVVLPICVQTILLFRIIAVYPPRALSLPVCMGLYGPALLLKAARVANACYLIYTVQRGHTGVPKSVASTSAAVWKSPYAKADWVLQLVDDVFVSTLFLLRIHKGIRFSVKHVNHATMAAMQLQPYSYAARLRTLFWIALSNFVFPVIFDIAQLVLIFCDSDYILGSQIVSVNSYVSILGVLFSTIWASGSLSVSGEAERSHMHSAAVHARSVSMCPPPLPSLAAPPRTVAPQYRTTLSSYSVTTSESECKLDKGL